MNPWPPLPLTDWRDTKDTLHRYAQIVGKVRMALVPFRNHWWHVTLLIGTRGLTTGPMPAGDGRTVEVAFDFVAHELVVFSGDRDATSFTLRDGLSCAGFYDNLFTQLSALGVDVRIDPTPYDLGGPPLSEDTGRKRYDGEAVGRYWTVVHNSADVLNEFAGWFNGKQSPVQLLWHSFDLALSRYSGRPAPPRPDADPVTAEAYSHEVIAFGFWPGDDRLPEPAYYSYTAPAPDGLALRPLQPNAAWWNAEAGTAYLRYDDVRRSSSPRETLLQFFASAYEAGATAAGWDIPVFMTAVAPTGGVAHER